MCLIGLAQLQQQLAVVNDQWYVARKQIDSAIKHSLARGILFKGELGLPQPNVVSNHLLVVYGELFENVFRLIVSSSALVGDRASVTLDFSLILVIASLEIVDRLVRA